VRVEAWTQVSLSRRQEGRRALQRRSFSLFPCPSPVQEVWVFLAQELSLPSASSSVQEDHPSLYTPFMTGCCFKTPAIILFLPRELGESKVLRPASFFYFFTGRTSQWKAGSAQVSSASILLLRKVPTGPTRVGLLSPYCQSACRRLCSIPKTCPGVPTSR